MRQLWKENIVQCLKSFSGHTSFYYKDLSTGEHFGFNEEEVMSAASVIKLTVMVELFRQLESKELKRDLLLPVEDPCRVPICGVLTLMHTGLEVTPEDLCWLMISISDNMATNMLIDLLGLEKIQTTIRTLGLTGVELNRKFFETDPAYQDKTNYITAAGIGALLERIYQKDLISPKASQTMLEMLLAQQCTNKIPLLLPGEKTTAHKTGEATGITHDVGILFAEHPCIVCFCNWKLEPGSEGKMNILIGQLAREIWDAQGGRPKKPLWN